PGARRPAILGVTAYESLALGENRQAFDEYVPKPVHLRELGAAIERLLG
ncbi:TPA: hypothetical protein QDC45_003209, partial [Burkholderia multivorans]|nr:hypothetical protein [Burkholderia multivorans]